MKWAAFKIAEEIFDLTHLHPCTIQYEREGEKDKPAEKYTVDVIFGLHCFTREPRAGESYDANLIYPDSYEMRLFDHRRYEFSKLLLDIVHNFDKKKPKHNGARRNFFTVVVVSKDGEQVEYDIFFKVKKIKKARLEMIIESAFVRDPSYESTRPMGKPISFWIILHNTMNNKPIRS